MGYGERTIRADWEADKPYNTGLIPHKPTEHQREDSEAIILQQHALLWADPGTGKTITALEATKAACVEKLVIICPKIAIDMWFEETMRHLELSPWDIWVQRSSKVTKRVHPASGKQLYAGPHRAHRKVFITTTDLIRADSVRKMIQAFCAHVAGSVMTTDEKIEYDKMWKRNDRITTALVIDEAHNFAKVNKRSAIVHGTSPSYRTRFIDLFDDVWQLTGSPVPRYADDLFLQLRPYRKDVLEHYGVETFEKFREKFCTTKMVQYGNMRVPKIVTNGNKNLDLLEQVLSSCGVIRRRLEDVVAELPPITYRAVSLDYDGVGVGDLPSDPDALIRELNNPDSDLASLRRRLGLAKVPSAVDYLIGAGYDDDKLHLKTTPTLVGFWHRDVGAALEKGLSDYGYTAVIDGSTPDKLRKQYIEEFNAGNLRYLLGQVRAMGVAANLQATCKDVFLVEELIGPEELNQFVARVYRRGQKQHVQVDLGTTDHELDEALRYVRANKKVGTDKIMKRTR